MVQQVQIHRQWACGMRCHEPAGQMSLSGTGRESLFLLSGQLHGWMSPREGRVWRKMREGRGRRGQAASEEKEKRIRGNEGKRRRNRRVDKESTNKMGVRRSGETQKGMGDKGMKKSRKCERKDEEAEGWRKIEMKEGGKKKQNGEKRKKQGKTSPLVDCKRCVCVPDCRCEQPLQPARCGL